MVHRIGRIILFSLYVPFGSPVGRYLIEIFFFAYLAKHFYEVVSSPVGVKFLGGGIDDDCEHESCQAFFER